MGGGSASAAATGLYARRVALRVVLAEDNYLVREGVGRLIGLEDDLEVVASCADYNSLAAGG